MDMGKVVKRVLKGLMFGKHKWEWVWRRDFSTVMKAVRAEGSRGAGRTQMGMERQGSRLEAVRRLQCGGLSHQATTSPCEPRRSRASQHFPVRFLIRTPHPSVLWQQSCVCGGRHHGEVKWRKDWRTSSTCWRSALSSTYAQNKSCRSKSEQQSPVPCVLSLAAYEGPCQRGAGNCVALTWCLPGLSLEDAVVSSCVFTQRCDPLPLPFTCCSHLGSLISCVWIPPFLISCSEDRASKASPNVPQRRAVKLGRKGGRLYWVGNGCDISQPRCLWLTQGTKWSDAVWKLYFSASGAINLDPAGSTDFPRKAFLKEKVRTISLSMWMNHKALAAHPQKTLGMTLDGCSRPSRTVSLGTVRLSKATPPPRSEPIHLGISLWVTCI